jgi:predicted hydrocarbon binding protein/KaiC/GvpD/RAD55 family RecA-like ATPase
MENRGLSLAEIREVPRESLVLLAGPPGAGKSDLCDQVVLNNIAMNKPVIFVTTEQRPGQVVTRLRDRGLGESAPDSMSFVDAYSQTVGVETPGRADTIYANCVDLNSISIATTRLQERMGRRGILLAFDSLTSPYLLSGAEVTRFMRLFLSRFAAEGNSVLALMDEGCGNEQDFVAMMSIADGVIKIEAEEDKRLFNVVKHPKAKPTRIEVPIQAKPPTVWTMRYDPVVYRRFVQGMFEGMTGRDEAAIRRQAGDFLNLFWPNLAHWSGMLWDPTGFPTMIYDLNKQESAMAREIRQNKEMLQVFPRQMSLLMRAWPVFQAMGFLPKSLGKVKDLKRMLNMPPLKLLQSERSGTIEYLEDLSKTDEHHFRVYESSDCWGFENVGTTVASHLPSNFAGYCKALEKEERDWNAIETKCIGLGDPYCEFKLVPGEIRGLKDSLRKDSSVIERIHERLMDHLMGFVLHGKPLAERPRLGSDVHLHVAMHAMGFPHLAGERYRMAQRMGGAKSGKEVGERLLDAGLSEDEAIERVIDFMNQCKVGIVAMDDTITIRENCESIRTRLFTATEEPSCYFTTGFLNGLFSAVRNQQLREMKCITAGDAYCEWEIM